MIEDDINQVNSYSELNQEKVLSVIKDVFGKTSKDIHIAQGCKTHGLIVRNEFNLYTCDDPECTSCREWDNAMKQELKKLNLVK
jgi:hypothetical protein